MTVRIRGGRLGSRTLEVPSGAGVRPTRSRVRQALFNILGQRLPGGDVLDLFAGTGALGLEAMSRGATRVVFVDADPTACRALRAAAASILPPGTWEVVADDVADAVARLGRQGRSFQWILADPPYGAIPAAVVRAVAVAGILRPGGRFALEHETTVATPEREDPLVRQDQRRYGRTSLSFYAAPDPAGQGGGR